MRMIFSMLGLLLVLVVVAIGAKKQWHSATTLPAVSPTMPVGAQPSNASLNNRDQSQQLQQQVQQQLQQAMEAASQSRAQADEK
jgi:hypothetical protein